MTHAHIRTALIALIALVAGAGLVLLVQHGNNSGSRGEQGSGVAATDTRAVPPFTGVELAGSNIVTIHAGDSQKVVVYADDNLLDRVTTEVTSHVLVIGNTPGSFDAQTPMRVDVSVPRLEKLTLTGSGVVVANGVRAPRLFVDLPGSGVIRASGTATALDATLGGSGDAQLDRLVARDAHTVVSGSGRILVTATNSLDAAVSGSGAIVYAGDPTHVTTSVTGSGAVTRG